MERPALFDWLFLAQNSGRRVEASQSQSQSSVFSSQTPVREIEQAINFLRGNRTSGIPLRRNSKFLWDVFKSSWLGLCQWIAILSGRTEGRVMEAPFVMTRLAKESL